ncbi:Transmembrane protein 87A [Sparganum proliferum]
MRHSAFLFCFISWTLAYPENGHFETTATLDTLFSFSKSAYESTNFNAEIACSLETAVKYNFKLLWSECAETFADTKAVNKGSEFEVRAQADLVQSVIAEGFGSFNCSPRSPMSLKAETNQSGSHLYLISVQCAHPNCDVNVQVTVKMDIFSDYGYLSAIEYPLRTFYGLLSLAYVLLGFLWLAFTFCYWKDLLRIQYYITLMMCIGICEQITLYAVYETLNKTGVAVFSVLIFAALVSCAKRTLARFLVMVVCVGYGITKSRLGALYRRVLFVCVVYFLCSAVDSGILVHHGRFKPSLLVLLGGLPLIFIDLVILWWSLSYLASTLRETRMRRNAVKYRLYRTFSGLLIFVGIVSVLCMIASVAVLHWRPCTKAWRFIWFDETFWQLLFFVVLVAIVFQWRPSSTNKLYARSAFLDTDVEPPPEDLEERLIDSIVSGISNDGANNDEHKDRRRGGEAEDEALLWAEQNIPPTSPSDRDSTKPPPRPSMKME